jgi:hypothetical protein
MSKRWQPPVWSTKVSVIRPNNRSNFADEESSREKVLSDHILRPMLDMFVSCTSVLSAAQRHIRRWR